MMYGWNSQGVGGGWWFVMIIAMVVFGLFFVVGMLSLLRHYGSRTGTRSGAPPTSPAIEILRERFARGEMTEEEYVRRRKLLGEGS